MTTDPKSRKEYPMYRGLLAYFPDACAAVANVSFVSTQQHHPNEPMHWDRDKSPDHSDCIARHLVERGTLDTDGLRHSAKLAWRALALLQIEIEAEQKHPTVITLGDSKTDRYINISSLEGRKFDLPDYIDRSPGYPWTVCDGKVIFDGHLSKKYQTLEALQHDINCGTLVEVQ